jgi:hypothetical protein
MSHVTFETARKLKDADLPQPEPMPGQVWYADNSLKVFVSKVNAGSISGHSEYPCARIEDTITAVDIFAPTATDIMQHLPGWYLSFENGIWICRLEEDEFVMAEFRSSNPAEAAAEAWFFEQSYAKK